MNSKAKSKSHFWSIYVRKVVLIVGKDYVRNIHYIDSYTLAVSDSRSFKPTGTFILAL